MGARRHGPLEACHFVVLWRRWNADVWELEMVFNPYKPL